MIKPIDANKKRNFPDTMKQQVYTLQDMLENSRYEQAGTTDTDSQTDKSKNYEGYAKVYKKLGRTMEHGGEKLGTKVKLDKHARAG
jgi:hypothetical protein